MLIMVANKGRVVFGETKQFHKKVPTPTTDVDGMELELERRRDKVWWGILSTRVDGLTNWIFSKGEVHERKREGQRYVGSVNSKTKEGEKEMSTLLFNIFTESVPKAKAKKAKAKKSEKE